MVTTLIIAGTILGVTALLALRGITIHYDKHFTIEDNRNSNKPQLTEPELKALEEKLNKPAPQITPFVDTNQDNYMGPMDSVIAEMHDLFGPDPEKDTKRRGGK